MLQKILQLIAYHLRSDKNVSLRFLEKIPVFGTQSAHLARARYSLQALLREQLAIDVMSTAYEELYGGIAENKVSPGALLAYELCENAVGDAICRELEDMCESYLADMRGLLLRQKHGEKGILRTDGSANIFFIRNVFKSLDIVRLVWSQAGWKITAHSIGTLLPRDTVIFARNHASSPP
ncbi:MAG TPA: hypothetical protein VD928_02490 [Candidatus Paceibacterota bacterium]|nr:hypothetical protein [Candidatus Paceibacterota bacterium]